MTSRRLKLKKGDAVTFKNGDRILVGRFVRYQYPYYWVDTGDEAWRVLREDIVMDGERQKNKI